MSYTQNTLSKGEEIQEIAKLHWINYLGIFLLTFSPPVLMVLLADKSAHPLYLIFIFCICIFISLPCFALLRLDLRTTEMVITNKRVICKTGIISVKTEELKNAKIESVEVKLSFLGRLLGYGNIYFSGTGTSKVKFKRVSNVWELKASIEEIIGD